jgi:hypothetical protein
VTSVTHNRVLISNSLGLAAAAQASVAAMECGVTGLARA